jgi:AMP-polyphosphate phosphotransferase
MLGKNKLFRTPAFRWQIPYNKVLPTYKWKRARSSFQGNYEKGIPLPLILYEYEQKKGTDNGKELDFIHEYNEYLPIIEKVLEKTNMPYAPWTIVGANDKNFATLKIITTAIQAIENYIEHITRIPEQQTIKYLDRVISKLPELSASVLDKVDLSQTITSQEHKESKKLYQQKLEILQYELFRKKRSIVIIFKGWDAAGKEETSTAWLKC